MSTTILFPGQGSQYIGMGLAAFDADEDARALFAQADDLLGFHLSKLMFAGPQDDLTDTVNQQPALYVAGLANWMLLQKQMDVQPAFMAGHSLGELTALAAAGSLSFADGLRLVRRRGELMKEAGQRQPGAMAAILALDVDQVSQICRATETETGRVVRLANDNCPGQYVISGHEDALMRAMDLAKEAGARKVVRLPITIAAHSPLMTDAAEGFAAELAAVSFGPPAVPVIGNVDARPLTEAEAIRAELAAQLVSPVAWTASMRYLLGQGADVFIEAGPGKVLLGLLKRIDRKTERIAFDKAPPAV